MAEDKTGEMRRSCHLILLCTDSSSLDLNTLRTIISHGVALTPSPGEGEKKEDAEESFSCLSSSTEKEVQSAEDILTNALLSTLQQTGGGSSAVNAANNGGTTTGINATASGTNITSGGGKGNKSSKGNNKNSAAANSTMSAPGNSANENSKNVTQDSSNVRGRTDWYKVVENPQWETPVAFIYQLPEIERGEGEGSLTTNNNTNTSRLSPSDFCETLYKALQIIADAMDAPANKCSSNIISTAELVSQDTSAQNESALPQQRAKYAGVSVVLALKDPRILTAVLGKKKSTTHPLDTRLIVNFVDGRLTAMNPSGQTNATGRSRGGVATAAGRRSAGYESTSARASINGIKETDLNNISADNLNTFDACIERHQRDGIVTSTVSSSAAASNASGVLCLRSVFENKGGGGGDEKSAWVNSCVRVVLPAMHHVVHDIARYTNWISSKEMYSLPITSPSPQQVQMPQPIQIMQTNMQPEEIFTMNTENITGDSSRTRTARLPAPASHLSVVATPTAATTPVISSFKDSFGSPHVKDDSSSLFFFPQYSSPQQVLRGEEEKWSYYVRERKVRGQWTCASAACALAAQVTVSLARQQQPKEVHPADDENDNKEKEKEGSEEEDKGGEECNPFPLRTLKEVVEATSPTTNSKKENHIGASLLLQLRQYASKRTVLATLDKNGNRNITSGGEKEKTISTAAAPTDNNMFAETQGSSMRPHTSPGTTSIWEKEKDRDSFEVTFTLPMDHSMDRPIHPPSPEEIREITRKFVKKGLGAFPSPPAWSLRDDNSFSMLPDGLQSVTKIQELLEETLNGFTLCDGEDAMDRRLLHLIEKDFQCTQEEMPCEWTRTWDDLVLSMGLLHLDEKLQSSVERILTCRERIHILQQIYLMQIAMEYHITGLPALTDQWDSSINNNSSGGIHNNDLYNSSSSINFNGLKLLTQVTTCNDVEVSPLRSLEESLTMPVCIRRIYEFQSRFGSHISRLIRCPIPDSLEALDGTLTASYSRNAKNLHPSKRVRAMMLGGIPVPRERCVHRVWCYYISGVPSVDEFNELVSSREMQTSQTVVPQSQQQQCASASPRSPLPLSPSPSNATPATNKVMSSSPFGGITGNLLRQQLLQHLEKAPQLIVLPSEFKRGNNNNSGGVGGICRSGGEIQTVLEGRHTLYPYEDSIVEVVTTDRGRMCRYVKSSELSCTLHYSIAPPPSSSSSSHFALYTSQQQQQQQQQQRPPTSGVATVISLPTSSPQSPRKGVRDETVYFTTAFDDGVVFTCTPQWSRRIENNDNNNNNTARGLTVDNENNANASLVSVRSTGSRRGRGASKANKRGAGTGRLKGGSREDGVPLTAPAVNSAKTEETPVIFPVAHDGSVLLWTAGPECLATDEIHVTTSPATTNAKTNTSAAAAAATATTATTRSTEETREIPKLSLTVSANGVTMHCEEQEGILWITQHESSNCPAPELLRSMHVCEANAAWQETIEVEVRRAVMEEFGAVCRYFHFGMTQTLYPDGSVVTRYPMPVGHSHNITAATGVVVETLITATGSCYVRKLGEGNMSPFLHVPGNTLTTHVTYDRGNRCRIVSRADGVIMIYYYFHSNPNTDNNNNNDNNNIFIVDDSTDSVFDTHILARVTLHADGTCITTFSDQVTEETRSHPPPPIRTLLEQVAVVTAACGSTVQYCIEAPSLPRVFVCAPTPCEISRSNNDNNNNQQQQQQGILLQGTASSPSYHVMQNNISTNKCANKSVPAIPLANVSDTSVHSPDVCGEENTSFSSLRRKPYDSFYVVFGDGSVLRRRVVYRGMRGNITPYLETLFTRSTATSLRVIHESALIVVEPSEAVRQNMESATSLAIAEGFAMFDVALGGLRLVDYQHYITEVNNIFSPGPIQAKSKQASLEFLLQQFVLPTYTPHKVTKARQAKMQQEEIIADAQSRRNRAKGICAPLITRLRELAERFVIEHDLLRTDILNTAKQQWECRNNGVGNKESVRGVASHESLWGNFTTYMDAENSATLQKILLPTPPPPANNNNSNANTLTMNTFAKIAGAGGAISSPSLSGIQASNNSSRGNRGDKMRMAPPMGILPVLFSELENDVVVQYIHHRDVEEFVRAKEAEPTPAFLSHSTTAGEPGIQQLTFFRVKAAAANGVADGYSSIVESSSEFVCAEPPSSGLLWSLRDADIGHSCAVAKGSLLGGAVQRQEKLALFSGKRLLFPTTQWFPQTLQPPRRFLKPHVWTQQQQGSGNIMMMSGGSERGGITVITDDDYSVGKNSNDPSGSLSSFEKLRVFFKFTEVTPTMEQVVLACEMRRREQLSSMMTYRNAINAMALEAPCTASDEQRRLREKYLTMPIT